MDAAQAAPLAFVPCAGGGQVHREFLLVLGRKL